LRGKEVAVVFAQEEKSCAAQSIGSGSSMFPLVSIFIAGNLQR
jgi:hypothetical protein